MKPRMPAWWHESQARMKAAADAAQKSKEVPKRKKVGGYFVDVPDEIEDVPHRKSTEPRNNGVAQSRGRPITTGTGGTGQSNTPVYRLRVSQKMLDWLREVGPDYVRRVLQRRMEKS